MKATAIAHPNIALVKYWGKRDEELILPHAGSLSMTLEGLSATTTVELHDGPEDTAQIDGRPLAGPELARVVKLLDAVRTRAGLRLRARMASQTDFPNAAGLASSAAGGAALAAAASWAAGLELPPTDLSILARGNSGSACRSIQGGFCEWLPGIAADGTDSYAVQVAPESHWPQMRMVVVICEQHKKKVSSREAMRRTVETSPYFEAWARCVRTDLKEAKAALLARDFATLGEATERSCWCMHAAAMAASPSIFYLRPATLAVLDRVEAMRASGLPVYLTIDAGPNPVLLCLEGDAAAIVARVEDVPGVLGTTVASPGRGVARTEHHVF